MIRCKDERGVTAPCAALRGDICTALNDTAPNCPFFKPRDVRAKELKELRARLYER